MKLFAFKEKIKIFFFKYKSNFRLFEKIRKVAKKRYNSVHKRNKFSKIKKFKAEKWSIWHRILHIYFKYTIKSLVNPQVANQSIWLSIHGTLLLMNTAHMLSYIKGHTFIGSSLLQLLHKLTSYWRVGETLQCYGKETGL